MKSILLNKNSSLVILKILTRVVEFSFFICGVKMMAGSIKFIEMGDGVGIVGTDLGLLGSSFELSADNFRLLGRGLELLAFKFLGSCFTFLVDFELFFILIFFFATQPFNCLFNKNIKQYIIIQLHNTYL